MTMPRKPKTQKSNRSISTKNKKGKTKNIKHKVVRNAKTNTMPEVFHKGSKSHMNWFLKQLEKMPIKIKEGKYHTYYATFESILDEHKVNEQSRGLRVVPARELVPMALPPDDDDDVVKALNGIEEDDDEQEKENQNNEKKKTRSSRISLHIVKSVSNNIVYTVSEADPSGAQYCFEINDVVLVEKGMSDGTN